MIFADAAAAEKRVGGATFVEAEEGFRLVVAFAQFFLDLEVCYHIITIIAK